MVDDIRDILAFYNRDPEREHLRLMAHQLEYDLTMRIMTRYLPGEGHLLEVGAATGRYTLPLAERGYEITAVDLSQAQTASGKDRLHTAGFSEVTHFLVNDVRNLSLKKEEAFSAALIMGPLYHLIEFEDRLQALREIYCRLHQGGLLFSTFISRFGIMGDLMKNVPEWIEKHADVASVLEKGHDPYQESEGFRGYFARCDEIAPLHELVGFETIALFGVEPAISADDDSYNRLKEPQRSLWLDLLERISVEPSILGASRHLLYIGRKPGVAWG